MPTNEPVRFEPRSAETWRDPFAMYRALRDHDPVHRVADNGQGEDYWVLSRFDDVFRAAVDSECFSSASGLTFRYDDMALFAGRETPLVMMDGDDHTELRKIAMRRFKPHDVRALEPVIREFVVERIEALRALGDDEGDVVQTLFKPLPSLVVSLSLGVPREDRALFDQWSWAITSASAEKGISSAPGAVAEMLRYFADLIALRRRSPGEDMISTLVHARPASGRPLSDEKILGMGFTMVAGGNDTVTGLLGGAAELLTRFPAERRRLTDRPERIVDGIEELLRLTSPVQGLARTATRDVTLHERTIPKGRKVLLLYASANRDEREFGPDADRCDVGRRIRRHLAFGYGAHFCIGATAARLQARIALEELLARCPDFSVDTERGRFAAGHFVRRYDALPFRARGMT